MDLLTLPIYIIIFIFGITVGSFLNVCIYRIPLGESVVTNPSHCMTCGKRLKWYEMFPVFSWLALKGRCSGCHTHISAQYPLIEAGNGVLWLLVFNKYGLTVDTALGCLLASVLVVASVIDANTREIPPRTTAFAAVLGILRFFNHIENWRSSLLGLVAVSGVLLILFYITKGAAIGGGDVKLMAATGLFLGFKLNLFAFFVGCIAGSIIHIIRMRFFGAGRDLAMGPYLAFGVMFAFLWGDPLIGWYTSLLGL